MTTMTIERVLAFNGLDVRMVDWGVLQGQFDVTTQINESLRRQAHELAAAVPAGRSR
jgi:hypothetical protein